MLEGMLHAHSGLRYIVLLLLVITVVKAIVGWTGKQQYLKADNQLAVWTLVFVHIQVLLGIVLYFWKDWHKMWPNMGDIMGDTFIRFFVVEHLIGMLIAVILITIGRSRSKKFINDTRKHKTVAIFFGIGLLIILLSIPWPFREALGRAWF